jgi:hypothetical protein
LSPPRLRLGARFGVEHARRAEGRVGVVGAHQVASQRDHIDAVPLDLTAVLARGRRRPFPRREVAAEVDSAFPEPGVVPARLNLRDVLAAPLGALRGEPPQCISIPERRVRSSASRLAIRGVPRDGLGGDAG